MGYTRSTICTRQYIKRLSASSGLYIEKLEFYLWACGQNFRAQPSVSALPFLPLILRTVLLYRVQSTVIGWIAPCRPAGDAHDAPKLAWYEEMSIRTEAEGTLATKNGEVVRDHGHWRGWMVDSVMDTDENGW